MIVTIEASSADELRSKILDLANMLGAAGQNFQTRGLSNSDRVGDPITDSSKISPADAAHIDAENGYPVGPEPRVRRRRQKAKDAPPKVEPETSSDEPEFTGEDDAPEAAAKSPTREDAIAALQKVNAKKSLAKAREVLSRFGCNRISELDPKFYQEFIELCEKTVG